MMGSVVTANIEEQLKPIVKTGLAMKNITVSNTAIVMSTTHPLNADTTHVEVTVDAQTITATFEGSTPAGTTVGHQYAAGFRAIWPAARWNAMRAIRTGGSDGMLRVTELGF